MSSEKQIAYFGFYVSIFMFLLSFSMYIYYKYIYKSKNDFNRDITYINQFQEDQNKFFPKNENKFFPKNENKFFPRN